MHQHYSRSSTRAGVYKPPYGGFVEMDIKEHKTIKLRTLVSYSSIYHILTLNFRVNWYQVRACFQYIHYSLKCEKQIDHSVIESFADGGRTCITARVYPEHVSMSVSHTYVFNNGNAAVKVSKLEAWNLATAAVNVEDGQTIMWACISGLCSG